MAAAQQDLTQLLQKQIDVNTESAGEVLPQMLRALRQHLGLDIAFVSRFSEGHRVLQYVDVGANAAQVQPGASDPLEASYCQRLVDGRIPEVIPDINEVPEVKHLPVTQALNVGSYLGVPIRMSDGSVYGTFCCIGNAPDRSLRQRDVDLMRVFAEVAGQLLEQETRRSREAEEIRRRTEDMLERGGMSIVFQPIRNVELGRTVGVEALARFADVSGMSADRWFNEAASVGLGSVLELRAVETALAALTRLPADIYLSCNVSPEVAMHEALQELLSRAPVERLVLEITEHATVTDYERMTQLLTPLRERGMRLAVDDAGAGYASFRHILMLRPDVIKLDSTLTQGIDTHPGRRALAAALIRFAEETGSQLVAEGVETEAELQALRSLRANIAQGYLVGRPLPLEALLEGLQAERQR